MFGLVCTLKSESLTDDAMPTRTKLPIHLLLHTTGSSLIVSSLLINRTDNEIDGLTLQLMIHISRLNNIFAERLLQFCEEFG